MWVITQHGFVSAVEYRVKKDHTDQLPEVLRPWTDEQTKKATRAARREHEKLVKDGFILARARVAEDLEQLRDPYFPDLMVVEDKGADYKFRAVLPRQAFADAMADAAWDIDYDSHFKEVVRERSPKTTNRYSAMMSTWTALNTMGRPETPAWEGYSGPKGISGSASIVHGSGMASTQNALPYGERRYPWEDDFERSTNSAPVRRPFGGNGDRRPLTSQEALKLAEYEAEALSNTREVTGRVGDRSVDTLAGMVEKLLNTPYEDIDADVDVPAVPYHLYEAVFEYLTPEIEQVDEEILVLALTDLLEDGSIPEGERDQYQELLDEMEGAEVPEPDPALLSSAAILPTPCEAAGHHLDKYRHTEEVCFVNSYRVRPGDKRCAMQVQHDRHPWGTDPHVEDLPYMCPGKPAEKNPALEQVQQMQEAAQRLSPQGVAAGGAAYPEASK